MQLQYRNHSELKNRVCHGIGAVWAVARRQGKGVRRGGFSLSEVMIAIFVMAIGLVSVFSLFPIGLLKVSQAVNLSQSADLGRSTLADIRVQGLLDPERYRMGYRSPLISNNPFVQDWGSYNPYTQQNEDFGENPVPSALRRYPGEPGLPICIDPEWIHHYWEGLEDQYPDADELQINRRKFPVPRLGYLRLNTTQPTFGMQRVIPTDRVNNDVDNNGQFLNQLTDSWINNNDSFGVGVDSNRRWPDRFENYLHEGLVHTLFSNRNNLIFDEELGVVPSYDHHNAPLHAHGYSTLLTAQLVDVSDEHTYHVSVVTFHNRDLAGEQAVTAIYLPRPEDSENGQPFGHPRPSNQIVLTWPYESILELEIPRNAWLLDATYTNPNNPSYVNGPARAHWYRIVDRGEPRRAIAGGMYVMRRIITVDRPVRAMTPIMKWGDGGNVLDGIDGDGDGLVDELDEVQTVNNVVNVAVIIPGVISVYEKTVTAR